MFDIGWTEMMVVAIVAILFVGPKELPGMLRMAGRTVKKIRGMASDVQRQFDDALREAELDDVKASINEVRDLNPTKALKNKLNPLKDDLDKAEREINEGETKPVKFDFEIEAERRKAKDKAASEDKKPSKKATSRKPRAKNTPPVKAVAKKSVATNKPARKPAAKKAAKTET